MIVTCPKCQTSYDIEEKIVQTEGRKLRCVRCDNIWIEKSINTLTHPVEAIEVEVVASPVEAIEAEVVAPPVEAIEAEVVASPVEAIEAEVVASPVEAIEAEVVTSPVEAIEAEVVTPPVEVIEAEVVTPPVEVIEAEVVTPPVEVIEAEVVAKIVGEKIIKAEEKKIKPSDEENKEDVFSRLSLKSENFETAYKKTSFIKRAWLGFKTITGMKSKANRLLLYLIVLILLILGSLYFRYEITREYPIAEKIYTVLGMDSKIIGDGLVFENVSREEEIIGRNVNISIKGYVVNTRDEDIDLPIIHIKLFSRNGSLIKDYKYQLKAEKIAMGDRKSFTINIEKPVVPMQYIIVTFI